VLNQVLDDVLLAVEDSQVQCGAVLLLYCTNAPVREI
jgi:hypothetical protein